MKAPSNAVIRRSVVLQAAPATVWELIRQPATFRYVTRGCLGFTTRQPDAEWAPGTTIEGRLWLCHLLPLWRHRITIAHVDEAARRIETSEQGGALRLWRHVLLVEPHPAGGTLYTDEITFDAGRLTRWLRPLLKGFFAYRQRRLKKLVQRVPLASRSL